MVVVALYREASRYCFMFLIGLLDVYKRPGGDLTAADGGHQLFQIGNLPDVGALVDETPYMNGQLAAVYILSLIHIFSGGRMSDKCPPFVRDGKSALFSSLAASFLSASVEDCPITVSYTHLDVYKRQ